MSIYRLEALFLRAHAKPAAGLLSQKYSQSTIQLARRRFATHRDPSPSSLLTSALDQKQRATQRDDSVGPFQLGLSQASLRQQENVKKWSELSVGGKVMRTTARTTNLTVILLGAGLSAVLIYALSSELFSKNSPTVLYGDACERIKASPRIAKYLHAPLVFHNNPPSTLRPRHRNRHVSSQITVDHTGREHMLLNFYVNGQASSSASVTGEESTLVDSVVNWTSDAATSLSELTLDETVDRTKKRASDSYETLKRAFKYLSGNSVPPASLPQNQPPKDVAPQQAEAGGVWSFAGLFSGLKGKRSSSIDGSSDRANGHLYTEGEVHADLIRNDEGYFVFRYLLIDIPNSGTRNPIRVFVEQGPGVRENEPIMRWHS